MFALAVTILNMLMGALLTPFALLAGEDPINIIVRTLWPSMSSYYFPIYVVQQLLTYMATQWCVLESCRVYSSTLLPIIIMFHVYLNCLENISKRCLTENTLHLYDQLYCINQIGLEFVRVIAGLLMSIGFLLVVVCNVVVIKFWDTLPFVVYALIVVTMLTTYFVILQTLPFIICSNERSKAVLSNWRNDALVKRSRVRYWLKVLKSRRSISFHYATTKFEKETKANYYSCIFNYTVDLIIVM